MSYLNIFQHNLKVSTNVKSCVACASVYSEDRLSCPNDAILENAVSNSISQSVEFIIQKYKNQRVIDGKTQSKQKSHEPTYGISHVTMSHGAYEDNSMAFKSAMRWLACISTSQKVEDP